MIELVKWKLSTSLMIRLNIISLSAFFNYFYKVSKGTQYFVDSVTHELRERERVSQTNDVMYELLKF